MSYQVLARKWRPQDFAELIGQESIVTALQNALRDGRVAQAYLFSGIRGVGKTTAARLLAKALNEDSSQGGPDITSGADLDVIEVDAATYSKVEQVRELTESLQYKPAGRRYKVVIIDEIHRLSRQAFDALLKIVEEPPEHLVFIFATTEIEAVPATILSRCQEFHFRRVPGETLVKHLRLISEAESIEVSDTALRLIARAGEGSVRDSVALLDQLATFGSGSIADEDAVRLLGGLDTALFQRLLSAMIDGDAAQVSAVVHEVEDQGWDPRTVFSQFLTFCRDALHLALGTDVTKVDLPTDQARTLQETARAAGYENLLRLLHQLLGSELAVRRSEAGALALEVAWLRAAELPKLLQVERVLARGPAPPSQSSGSGTQGRGSAASPRSSGPQTAADVQSTEPAAPAEAQGPAPAPKNGAAAAPQAEAPTPVTEPTKPPQAIEASEPRANGESAEAVLAAFREYVARERQPLAAHLDAALELHSNGTGIVISIPAGDTLLRDTFARQRNREVMDQAAEFARGAGTRWKVLEVEVPSPAPSEAADTSASEASAGQQDEADDELDPEIANHPTVQAVLDIFGGEVRSIETNSDSALDAGSTEISEERT